MLNLPHPHGECISDWSYNNFNQTDYNPSKCKMDKMTKFIIDKCDCMDFYMPQLQDQQKTKFCLLENYHRCLLKAKSTNP